MTEKKKKFFEEESLFFSYKRGEASWGLEGCEGFLGGEVRRGGGGDRREGEQTSKISFVAVMLSKGLGNRNKQEIPTWKISLKKLFAEKKKKLKEKKSV